MSSLWASDHTLCPPHKRAPIALPWWTCFVTKYNFHFLDVYPFDYIALCPFRRFALTIFTIHSSHKHIGIPSLPCYTLPYSLSCAHRRTNLGGECGGVSLRNGTRNRCRRSSHSVSENFESLKLALHERTAIARYSTVAYVTAGQHTA